ncbi:HNH endonuclease signature motif containing protein [Actinomadura fibrosa]|uniref:DUF222 domain-containing protein n=1 Tax=Actinomadura fibrosa TaxID=111802 RepID=A0ABW2XAS6_9ACTN|nr:HNH endonuclease signature motif containing protein [Actinomadura fibrosa]
MHSEAMIDMASMSTTELVDAAALIAAELARREVPDSPSACMEQAEALGRVIDSHESALAGRIARVDVSGEMRRWGLPSAKAWLRTRMGMREARATDRITLARQRPRLPAVTERLATGRLSYGYAATIAAAVARLDDADCTRAETLLLDMTDQGFSAGKLAAFGARIRDVIAERDGTDKPDPESKRGYERSWITSTRSLDGGRYLKGWLNAEDAAVWDGALGPLAKPAGTDDHRDLSERTAAALSSVLSGGHTATKVTVICDLDTLTGGQAPARLADGTPIPAVQARRIALTAGVSPLLLGRGNIPLYLGHRVRFATPAQRQVLETLYSTCAVQGCEVPGALCEVDHVKGWALNGSPTDIDQLALCCGWHNRHKHTHPDQMQITKAPDGRYTYRLLPPPSPATTQRINAAETGMPTFDDPAPTTRSDSRNTTPTTHPPANQDDPTRHSGPETTPTNQPQQTQSACPTVAHDHIDDTPPVTTPERRGHRTLLRPALRRRPPPARTVRRTRNSHQSADP